MTNLHRFFTPVFTATILLIAGGCGNSEHEHSEHEAEHSDIAEAETSESGESAHIHGDEIVFPAAKAKAAGVKVAKVEASLFSEVIPVSGRIIANPGGEATVVATKAGIVTLAKPWTVGMPVGQGSALFSISASRLPDGDPAAKARIDLAKAKSDFERAEKLHKEQLISAQEYQDARSAYESARLIAQSNQAAGSGAAVAPKSGYVLQCLVKDGDYVEVGAPLMTITQNRRLRLQADLPQREFGKIGNIRSANFRLSQSPDVYALSDLNGRIVSHGNSSEGTSSFIPVIFEFDNAAGVAAGAFAEVWLIAGAEERVISLPRTALTEEQGVTYAYVRIDDNCYDKRQVQTGRTDGARVEILSGLHEGDMAVVKGAVNVKLAGASAAIPAHTHNH